MIAISPMVGWVLIGVGTALVIITVVVFIAMTKKAS